MIRPTETVLQAKTPDSPDRISIPLYVAGLVVAWCGIQAVNVTVEDTSFSTATQMLTVLGFLFSFGCRWLQIRNRWIQVGCVVFIAAVSYQLLSSQFSFGSVLRTEASGNDTQITVFLAWVALVFSWALFSDASVLFCCVLSMAILGLIGSINLNTTVVVYFFVYVIAMIFLLIHQNSLRHNDSRSDEEPDQAAHNSSRILISQFAMAAVFTGALITLGALLVIPLQSVLSHVSLAQAIRQLSQLQPGTPLTTAPSDLSVDFSDDSSLSIGAGQSWSSSPTLLLTAVPSDHQRHYWRGRTFDQYTGDGWSSTLDDETKTMSKTEPGIFVVDPALQAGLPKNSPATVAASTKITVKGVTQQLFYPAEPLSISLPAEPSLQLQQHADGRFDMMDHPRTQFTYLVTSHTPLDIQTADLTELRRAGRHYPETIKRLYLSPIHNDLTTPDDLLYFQSAVVQACRNLRPNQRTPVDRALAIQSWVAARCVYSLSAAPIPDNVDHVHNFLETSRTGYCDLFASSMAVLCRTAGIPARVAVGFAPGDWDGQEFNIRAMDKHAWVEVFFPGYGWITFDPTTGTATDSSAQAPSAGKKSFFAALWGRLDSQGIVPNVLIAGIIAMLGFVLKRELYDRFIAPRWKKAVPGLDGLDAAAAGPNEAGQLRIDIARRYKMMLRALARLGLPRRAWETPFEYQARAVPFLLAKEAALGVSFPVSVVTELTDQFTAVSYGAGEAIESLRTAHASAKGGFESFQKAASQACCRQLMHRLFHRKSLRTRIESS